MIAMDTTWKKSKTGELQSIFPGKREGCFGYEECCEFA